MKAKIKKKGLTLELLADDSLYTVDWIAVHITQDSNYRASVRLLEVPSMSDWIGKPQ